MSMLMAIYLKEALLDVNFKNISIDKISYSLPIEQALTNAEIELDDKLGNARLTLNLPSQELQIHNFTINIGQLSNLLDEIKLKQNFKILLFQIMAIVLVAKELLI